MLYRLFLLINDNLLQLVHYEKANFVRDASHNIHSPYSLNCELCRSYNNKRYDINPNGNARTFCPISSSYGIPIPI